MSDLSVTGGFFAFFFPPVDLRIGGCSINGCLKLSPNLCMKKPQPPHI